MQGGSKLLSVNGHVAYQIKGDGLRKVSSSHNLTCIETKLIDTGNAIFVSGKTTVVPQQHNETGKEVFIAYKL